MNRILLVEDDRRIAASLTDFLISEGFSVQSAEGQQEALQCLRDGRFDLVLLDVSLRDGNGFSVCTTVKSRYDTPVIFLTASGDEGSIVAGLDLGADDYISKPFRPRELISRMKNALRRYQNGDGVVRVGGIAVDTDRGTVTRNGKEVALSALEYRILLLFVTNRGRLLTRAKLLEDIWDISGDYVNDNTLTVYMKRIRDKLEENPADPQLIKTVRGLGYRMD